MVEFMYRDLEKLKIISISDDDKKEFDEVNSYLKKDDILERIGFDYFLENKDKGKTIDMLFYEQLKDKLFRSFQTYLLEKRYAKRKLIQPISKKRFCIYT